MPPDAGYNLLFSNVYDPLCNKSRERASGFNGGDITIDRSLLYRRQQEVEVMLMMVVEGIVRDREIVARAAMVVTRVPSVFNVSTEMVARGEGGVGRG